MKIDSIQHAIPIFEDEGYFGIIFNRSFFIEVSFYDLLDWITDEDHSLLAYLGSLPEEYLVHEEVSELLDLGYDFKEKIFEYLTKCEEKYPGFMDEFCMSIEHMPTEILQKLSV